jgi:integrase
MTRTIRDGNLGSRSGRAGLKASPPNPYWLVVAPNQAIGYNKPKKGAGTWRARLYLPESRSFKMKALGTADDYRDANGTTILDFKQAQDAAAAWFEEYANEATRVAGGEPAQVGPYTVADALKAYFEDGKRRGVKGLQRDKARARAWITPELGPLELAKLTRRRLETWLAKMAEAPRRVRTPAPPAPDSPGPKPRNFRVPRTPKPRPEPPAPPATDDEKRARKDSANRVLTTLKSALNHALDRRQVMCSGEAWKAVKPYHGTTSARIRFLSPEDQVRLVNVCPPDFRRLVRAALYTGGRYGELARATVQDFDPTGGTLFLIGKGTGEGKPRRVVLTEEGQAFFQEIAAGLPAGELLFQRDQVKRRNRQEIGSAWGQSDQSRFMTATCTAAGLDPLGFHELRHSYASMLVNAGCPLAYVAAQLGHTDTRMVEKHYGHLAPSALADSIRTLMPKLGLMDSPKVEPLKVSGVK